MKHILQQLLCAGDWKRLQPLRTKYVDLLRQYYYEGGMP
jgi:hypothetical protein